MTDTTPEALAAAAPLARPSWNGFVEQLARKSEAIVIPVAAIVVGLIIFSIFLVFIGKSPLDFLANMWRGGFGSIFSLENSLTRTSPPSGEKVTAFCSRLARMVRAPRASAWAARPRGRGSTTTSTSRAWASGVSAASASCRTSSSGWGVGSSSAALSCSFTTSRTWLTILSRRLPLSWMMSAYSLYWGAPTGP